MVGCLEEMKLGVSWWFNKKGKVFIFIFSSVEVWEKRKKKVAGLLKGMIGKLYPCGSACNKANRV